MLNEKQRQKILKLIAEYDAPKPTRAPMTDKMKLVPGSGGAGGPNTIIMIGDKCVGWFYADEDEGTNAQQVLQDMVDAYNAQSKAQADD